VPFHRECTLHPTFSISSLTSKKNQMAKKVSLVRRSLSNHRPAEKIQGTVGLPRSALSIPPSVLSGDCPAGGCGGRPGRTRRRRTPPFSVPWSSPPPPPLILHVGRPLLPSPTPLRPPSCLRESRLPRLAATAPVVIVNGRANFCRPPWIGRQRERPPRATVRRRSDLQELTPPRVTPP
jgi:hypothetical protein